MFNHAFAIAFSIETPKSDPDTLTEGELIAAIESRLNELKATPGLVHEACGAPFDSYEFDPSIGG